ncbi:hypothetical protein BS50DRAFT_44508 [Corynespora cassiicola Philippines]|uniref:Uncharacterized protein n=1 Tax=Corynespora cassiicola Philippines TaxID=1448308 RepID=A0A2T2PDC7_CORCC|nr:hypothetical protein BS50DRAFT_44508 [Corynespora cassiicola Philippines]
MRRPLNGRGRRARAEETQDYNTHGRIYWTPMQTQGGGNLLSSVRRAGQRRVERRQLEYFWKSGHSLSFFFSFLWAAHTHRATKKTPAMRDRQKRREEANRRPAVGTTTHANRKPWDDARYTWMTGARPFGSTNGWETGQTETERSRVRARMAF